MLNFLDTQRTHSVFASDWFQECGDFNQEQEERASGGRKIAPEEIRSPNRDRSSPRIGALQAWRLCLAHLLSLFELSRVLVPLDHVASRIANANLRHG